MKVRIPSGGTLSPAPLFAALLVVGTISTLLFAYRATQAWQQSTEESVRARGGELVALLALALRQDMRGGETYLLQPINLAMLEESSPYDIADRCAGVFARFPYIESFFIWRRAAHAGDLVVYNRSERLPPWDDVSGSADLYPIVIRSNPQNALTLVSAVLSESADDGRFAAVDGQFKGTAYQLVAQRLYDDRQRLAAVVGFTVNMDWVRANYFGNLVEQVQRLGGDASMRLEIVDANDRVLAHAGPDASGRILASRSFPLLFSEHVRALSAGDSGDQWPVYVAHVDIGRDAALTAARRGAVRTLGFLAVGTTAALAALFVTLRASRAAAALALRQAEFVSAVSHEMKTPLSMITLTGDSLANGRCSTPAAIREYGRLLAAESRQLGLLIDNVLCYARLSDEDGRRFDTIDLSELVCESIDRFRLQCEAIGCSVSVDASGVLFVKGDRRMLRDLFDNLIDNALKYGGDAGDVIVRISSSGERAVVEISDVGPGIPAKELELVFEKFRRGSKTEHKYRGSGLGLTIARRLADLHQGHIELRSIEGRGTTVRVDLPLAIEGDAATEVRPNEWRSAVR
jgi:signal transduction histidine kinase